MAGRSIVKRLCEKRCPGVERWVDEMKRLQWSKYQMEESSYVLLVKNTVIFFGILVHDERSLH